MDARSRVRQVAKRLLGNNVAVPRLDDVVAAGHASVGRRTYGNPRVHRWLTADGGWSGGDVHVGAFCSIGGEVSIFTGGEHNPNWTTTFPVRILYDLEGKDFDGHPRSRGDVRIGNDVWVGAGAWIMSGVSIGHGAVVGAGAVVDRDVRPYAIVAGNRARETRRRFDDKTIERLLDLKWWDWPDAQIIARVDELCAPPDGLLSNFESHS